MDEESNKDEAPFEEPTEDQTPEEDEKTPEKKEDDKEPDTRRSEIAQKIKWRERAQKAEERASKVDKLEAELAELRGAVKKPTDEAEQKAQEYIRAQARKVYEELQEAKQKEESTKTAKFEAEVESLLDENPDISETELLDAIEEYEVEPKTALKILKKQTDSTTKKPKMPSSKRAPTETKSAPDDSKKSMWDIQREEIEKVRQSS